MQGVIAVTKRQSTGLVVSRHDDQCLVRMRLVERISHFQCLVHIPYFSKRRSRIVAMAGIIDHAAFYHHKEPVISGIQERNSRADNLFERQIPFFAVYRVGQVTAVLGALVVIFLYQDHLFHLRSRHRTLYLILCQQCLSLFVSMRDGIAFLLS